MAYCRRCSARASLFAPASIRTKMFVSDGITAAIPGRSMPGSVRSLIVVAATAAPVCPALTMAAALAFFHQIDRAADGRIFFPPDGLDRAVGHLDYLGGVDDLDAAVVATVLLQLLLDLRRVADEEQLIDVRIFPQRHAPRRPRYSAARNRRPWHRERFSSERDFADFRGGNAKPKKVTHHLRRERQAGSAALHWRRPAIRP